MEMRRIAIGKIVSSVGTRGFFVVKSYSGESGHFKKLEEVFLQRQEISLKYLVEEVELQGNKLCMKLHDIDSPEQVTKLTGQDIWVDESKACALNEGEYYISSLLGLKVVKQERSMGVIKNIFFGNGMEILEVEKAEGTIIMIPFNQYFINRVDTEKRSVFLTKECVLD